MNKISFLVLVFLLSGCASRMPNYRAPALTDSQEGLIAVEYLDMTNAENLYKGTSDFSKIIAEYLAGALQEKHFRVVAVERQSTQVSAKYRVTGAVTKITPGSLAGRFWVGPGVGMARISAEAVLTRISDNKELDNTKVTLSSSACQDTEQILRYISANVARKIANKFSPVFQFDGAGAAQ